MKQILFLILISTFILLRPYLIQEGGFWYNGDDQDYFAHSSAIVFGTFPSYKNEYLVINKNYPQSSIGCSLLVLPFVGSFSLIDRLTGSSIVQKRTPENIPRSWSQFGFLLAGCFYFALACFLLYRGLRYCIEERYAFLAVALTVFCQGIPLYAYRRPIFSHTAEFFLQCLCVFFLLRNITSEKKYPSCSLHYFILGLIGGLIFLTRYNNIGFALGWPLVFILLSGFSIRSLKSWKNVALTALGLISLVGVFKIWPEISAQQHPYPWIMKYLLRPISFPDLIHRLDHIFLGIDWGLLYTAPYMIIGWAAICYLKYPAKKYILPLCSLLLINFYIVIVWGNQGSWHGYRYLLCSSIPLLALPVASLIKNTEQRTQKKLTWLWGLIAVPPALSMLCFEAKNSVFNLYLTVIDFGEMDFTNSLYQSKVWETVLFKPFQLFEFACAGSGQYLYHLMVSAMQKFGLWTNGYMRNYAEFDIWTLVKLMLIYVVPFLLIGLLNHALKSNNADEKRP